MTVVAMASPSSLGSSCKRSRAVSSGSPRASCLVDGCVSDLSKCRQYYRRHKVCEVHSKTAIVVVGGREQRFCQQCSRFHLLVEFDETKRSCRKRLEGHNIRRRKPQLRSLDPGVFMTNHQGTRIISYPQIFSTSVANNSNWVPAVKTEEVQVHSHHLTRHLINGHQEYENFHVLSGGIYKDGKKLSLLQDNVHGDPAAACQPLLKNISAAALQSSRSTLLDSDCALSLLSSWEDHPSRNRLGQVAAAGDSLIVAQPLIPGVQCDGIRQCFGPQASESCSPTGFCHSAMEHEHVRNVLMSERSDTDLQCQGLFHVGGEGPSYGNPQGLSFSWQ